MPREAKAIQNKQRRRPPATTIEARENQMIALAVDLAEKQLMAGTASSQVITHFLKLGSLEKKLELEILREEKKLKAAKTEALTNSKKMEELYSNAIEAMKTYAGIKGGEDDDLY